MGEAICDYYYHVAIPQSSHASYYQASQRPVAASMVARTDSFGNPSRSIFQTLILCKIGIQTGQLVIRRDQNEHEHASEVIFRHQLLPRLYLCLCRGMLEIPIPISATPPRSRFALCWQTRCRGTYLRPLQAAVG